MSVAAFDRLAARYDEMWTNTAIGRAQRDAVWRAIDGLFQSGDRVLDLGCGTGEDALHLAASGVSVHAIDASPEMIARMRARMNARAEGLCHAERMAIEDLNRLDGRFDGAISNFGALNCVRDWPAVADQLARLVRPGGHLVMCIMGRHCLWEALHFGVRGRLRAAFRRWRRGAVSTSLGMVFYPSVARVRREFHPQFRLVDNRGVGIFVPPSYVRVSEGVVERLAPLDRMVCAWPVFRGLADHRLLVFVRN